MGSSSIPQEHMDLDCRFSSSIAFVPRTISSFSPDVMKISDRSLKVTMLDEYINRLEDEMKKIDAFKRELPHIMILINDAIVMMKEELTWFKKSNQEPVLEEFIPIKKINSSDVADDKKEEKSDDRKESDVINSRDKDNKMDWMSSVQLWNSHDNNNDKKRKETDRTSMDHHLPKNRAVERAFMSFKMAKEDKVEVSGLSLRVPEIKNLMEGIDTNNSYSKKNDISSKSSFSRSNYNAGNQQSWRKQRRCWSPDLHQRFITALDQLGGPHVATPKQIRELMKVDGLTNDEVKSHLQKYRLHLQKSRLSGRDESSKGNNSKSSSPEGPLHLNGYLGTNGGDSFEDDDKSESIQLSCRD